MGKRNPQSMKRNAQIGAVKRQCPKCQRKAALSGLNDVLGDQYITARHIRCRWCDYELLRTTNYTVKPWSTTERRIDLGE